MEKDTLSKYLLSGGVRCGGVGLASPTTTTTI